MTRRGTPVQKATAAGRFYEVQGQLLPSVTNILGAISRPALIPWAASVERTLVSEAAADLYAAWAAQTVRPPLPRSAYLTTLLSTLGPTRAHQRQLEQAGDIGSQTHKLVEWALRVRLGAEAGPEPVVCQEARHGFETFDRWAESVKLKPVLVERQVYSLEHGYAGTLDLLARVNGVLTVIDLKTSKAIWSENYLQVVAYQMAMQEMGYLATDGLIVRLPKVVGDPEFEVKPVPPAAELFPVFLAAKALWSWQQTNDKPARRPGPRRVA
jgi:hypothetical protein